LNSTSSTTQFFERAQPNPWFEGLTCNFSNVIYILLPFKS
jgi:hypothetical protein